MNKKFAKTTFLFIVLGFGTAYIAEFLPFIDSKIAILPILTALSILIETEQHRKDGCLRYMMIDSIVDIIGSLGIKKILDLIGDIYHPISDNIYVEFLIMLFAAAAISNWYNSKPKDEE